MRLMRERPWGGGHRKEGRMFFLERNNQRPFVFWGTWPVLRAAKITKVFCFFSSEKKTFLP
jgi:hypothetical protein